MKVELSHHSLHSLDIKTRPTSSPNVRRIAGRNDYLVGQGRHGGKSHGLLFLKQLGYKAPPIACLRTGFFASHFEGKPPRSFEALYERAQALKLTERDFDTIQAALNFLGIQHGPIAVRSDCHYESVGAREVHNRLASPAGLLETQLMIYNQADTNTREILAERIQQVFSSGFNPDFAAFCRKNGLPPPPMAVALQPFLATSHPAWPGVFHPYYSAVIDTSREGVVRVCVGYGAGTFVIGRRGQGFMHEYHFPLLEHARSYGRQTHFEFLDGQGVGLSNFSDHPNHPRLTAFLEDPNNFIFLARLGRELQTFAHEGQGICLEAAAEEAESTPSLLQLNPVKKVRPASAPPNIGQDKVLLRTSSVIGQGHRHFSHVVAVICPDRRDRDTKINLRDILQRINQSMEGYLLIVPGYLTSIGLGTSMSYRCFSNAGAVIEYESDVHETGSGMDHFTRLCHTGDVMYIETHFGSFGELARRIFPRRASLPQLTEPGVHLLGDCSLSLWADEEADNGRGDGILYYES